eukprot:gene16791-23068_t
MSSTTPRLRQGCTSLRRMSQTPLACKALQPPPPAASTSRVSLSPLPFARPGRVGVRSHCSQSQSPQVVDASPQAMSEAPRASSAHVINSSQSKPRNSRHPRSSRASSLQAVPGIGPKNEALFKAHGVQTLSDLKQRHLNFHRADEGLTKDFVEGAAGIRNRAHGAVDIRNKAHSAVGIRNRAHGAVGIRNRAHVSSIMSYLREETFKAAAQAVPVNERFTVSVEGNISAGKSTFLNIVKGSKGVSKDVQGSKGVAKDVQGSKGVAKDVQGSKGVSKDVQVVPEPVEQWQNVGAGKVNLLMEFYKAPERFAYTFQNYVFLTRLVQERDSYMSSGMCRLLERSVFSDRMVFVRAVHSAKFMNDTELSIYDSWFDPVLQTLPTLVPNGFIYLRAGPDTCHRRMTNRGRNEENSVHHSGLDLATESPPAGSMSMSMQSANAMASSPAGYKFELPPVPKALRDNMYILDAKNRAHMHPTLDQIPALILDCDDDIDIDQDEAYKEHVKEYTQYVKKFMQAKSAAAQGSDLQQAYNGYYLKDTRSGAITYTNPLAGPGTAEKLWLPNDSARQAFATKTLQSGGALYSQPIYLTGWERSKLLCTQPVFTDGRDWSSCARNLFSLAGEIGAPLGYVQAGAEGPTCLGAGSSSVAGFEADPFGRGPFGMRMISVSLSSRWLPTRNSHGHHQEFPTGIPTALGNEEARRRAEDEQEQEGET